jgi:hypothetical protein
MRTVALAIALLMSGAAVAQSTTTQPDVDVDADVGVQPDGDLDVDADVDVGTKTTTTNNTMHNTTTVHTATSHGTTLAGGQMVAPSNANPERDARGIAVISDPAVVPAGWNGTTGTAVGGPLIDATTGETTTAESVRPCTATVTDNCVQTYERGRSR